MKTRSSGLEHKSNNTEMWNGEKAEIIFITNPVWKQSSARGLSRVTASTHCRDQSRSPLYCSELAVMILSVPEMVSPGLYTTLLWLKVMSKSCSLPIVSRCRSARKAKRVRFGLIRAVDGGVSRDVAPAAFPPLSLSTPGHDVITEYREARAVQCAGLAHIPCSVIYSSILGAFILQMSLDHNILFFLNQNINNVHNGSQWCMHPAWVRVRE